MKVRYQLLIVCYQFVCAEANVFWAFGSRVLAVQMPAWGNKEDKKNVKALPNGRVRPAHDGLSSCAFSSNRSSFYGGLEP